MRSIRGSVSGVILFAAAVLTYSGCADKGAPDYARCVQLEAKGDVSAWDACNAAVAADPTSKAGMAAAAKLVEMKPKHEAWQKEQRAQKAAAEAKEQARKEVVDEEAERAQEEAKRRAKKEAERRAVRIEAKRKRKELCDKSLTLVSGGVHALQSDGTSDGVQFAKNWIGFCIVLKDCIDTCGKPRCEKIVAGLNGPPVPVEKCKMTMKGPKSPWR